MPAPANFQVAHERSFDVTTDGTGRRKFSTDAGAPLWAVGYCIKADKGNSTDLLVGEGAPTYPLIPGETRYSDLPPGTILDVSRLQIAAATSGTTIQVPTSGQILHVTIWEVTINAPAGTKPAATTDPGDGGYSLAP